MAVHQEIRGRVLLVTVDNPPVNALSVTERSGLIGAVELAAVADVDAVVICGAGGSFIAGADVREFGKPPLPPHLPDAVAAIEACPKPVIAAINGQALGGGLEVALGCHYRIAALGTRLGLPEVTLGVVPGAGGTQRLPRLIDPVVAARMASDGKPIGAAEAHLEGLIDRVADGDLTASALSLAEEIAGQDIGARRTSMRPAPDQARFAADFLKLEAETRRVARGSEAPLEALRLVRLALVLPFAEGILKERETFLGLRAGPQASALRHIFFAERAAAKPPADVAGSDARPIERVGIIGAGTMGRGIAMSVADAGLPVTLIERAPDALLRGLEQIAETYRQVVERGRLASDAAEQRIGLIRGGSDYSFLSQCDLIIEAAFESLAVKHEIFGRLADVAKPGAILASNTSYLDINSIAGASGRPADVVGIHYFSPANVMKLLEIVRPAAAAPDVIATALAFAKRTAKVPVVAGVCTGFIGNRMLRAYTREAGLLLLEGASPTQIDEALTDFGMAMGPFAVSDLSGIDIAYRARREMAPGSYEPLAVAVHDGLVEAGHLGRKSGSGFYVYDSVKRGKAANPLVDELLSDIRERAAVEPRVVTDEEIVDRCMLALANEGGHIVMEEIAARPGDVDVVYINGYGFPRHRGGPMYFAQQRGHAAVRQRLAALADSRFGRWWSPSSFFEGD